MTQSRRDTPSTSSSRDVDLDRLASAVVACANDAIMAVDRTGRIVLWNDACEALFGWTAAQMRGQEPDVLLPEDRRCELERVAGALRGVPESGPLETERLHRAGHVVPVSRRTCTLYDAEGEVLGVCAVFHDLRRERQLRQELGSNRHLAEARFRQSPVPQATLSSDGVLLDVNPALCRLTGYDDEHLLGRPTTDLLAEPHLDAAGTPLTGLPAQDLGDGRREHLLRHADGHLVETRISAFAVRDDLTGEVLRVEATLEDVSAAAAAARELHRRDARWQSLAVHAADVGFLCSADGEVLFVGPSLTARLGYLPDDVLGKVCLSLWHPEDEPGVRAVWRATVTAGPGTTSVFEGRLRHADGSWRWVEETVTNRLDDPAVAAMVGNLRDITERRSAEAVLQELAGTDALTGLPTRAPLMAALDAAFASDQAARTAVAVLDLSSFKLVNDSHGHRGGDEVLREVAVRLTTAVASRGVVARIGGDRFGVVLRDLDEISDVFEVLADVLADIERPMELGERVTTLSASVGAALGPAVDSGALLSSAEAALGKAKEGLTGPMHVVRAESSSASLFRARLVEDLRRGIAQDELVVHYQPVVSLSDGRPVGAEALVRWNHPTKGLLSPGAFMEAAEDSGLVLALGRKVLEEACTAAARWAVLASGSFHVAVNLSARQLAGGDVVETIRECLASSGLPAQHLTLEVTESAVMADVDGAVATLQELRDLGASIAVDDFGTGYSSLTYLKQFPVTTLKIDRSFVNGLGHNGDDAAIVSSVISLAKAMQLECIAEGVETEQQRLVLQALGCVYGQGFLWSPALPPDALDRWLAAAGGRQGPLARRPAPSTARSGIG